MNVSIGIMVRFIFHLFLLGVVCVLPAHAENEFARKTTNVPIPDAGDWAISRIDITDAPEGATVTDVEVSFQIVHPYSGDLQVDLEVGTYANNKRLWNNEGEGRDNPNRTISTSAFNGLPVNNSWWLYARDTEALDSGYIDEWSIRIYYSVSSSDPNITQVNNGIPVIASNERQWVEVRGSDFQNNLDVYVSWPGGGGWIPSSQIDRDSSSRVNIYIRTTMVEERWGIRIRNPDGSESNTKNFNVKLPSSDETYQDQYPFPREDPNNADPWLFYYRECTSYVAWRVNHFLGVDTAPWAFHNYLESDIAGALGRFSDAENWDDRAVAIGLVVNTTPEVGAIAHWNAGDQGYEVGHVAFVEEVNVDGSVNLTEYNFPSGHRFNSRFNIRAPRYIHVQAPQPLTAFGDAFDIGGGIKWSEWFEWYYGTLWPWVYDFQHNEWCWVVDNGPNNIWIWSTRKNEWLWTTTSDYPQVYHSATDKWGPR